MELLKKDKRTYKIRDIFLRNAQLYPNNIALVTQEKQWTYSQLEAVAKQWSATLLKYSDGKNISRVGILSQDKEVSYISILTSLFLNSTFVPMHYDLPTENIQNIINDTQLDFIIVDKKNLLKVEELKLKNTKIFSPLTKSSEKINYITKNQILKTSDNILNHIEVEMDSCMYILFTSGSTGKPKGVPVTYNNVENYLKAINRHYNINKEDRIVQTFESTFDLFIGVLLMAWSNGASIYNMNSIDILTPIEYVNRNKITIWFSVPSIPILLKKRLKSPHKKMNTLRLSLFCGEALPNNIAQFWSEISPNSKIENLYGPTELTITCTRYEWSKDIKKNQIINGMVPIGELHDGLEYVLINSNDQITENQGELCIAGEQLFPGYLNNISKTLDAFIYFDNKKYYKTGDIVREIENNLLTFITRKDNQVKVMGHRIELNEVEGAVREVTNALECVVLGVKSEYENNTHLVCFITTSTMKEQDIKKQLESKLTKYMIPKRIHHIEEMPLNTNGKIDRKQLAKMLEGEIF